MTRLQLSARRSLSKSRKMLLECDKKPSSRRFVTVYYLNKPKRRTLRPIKSSQIRHLTRFIHQFISETEPRTLSGKLRPIFLFPLQCSSYSISVRWGLNSIKVGQRGLTIAISETNGKLRRSTAVWNNNLAGNLADYHLTTLFLRLEHTVHFNSTGRRIQQPTTMQFLAIQCRLIDHNLGAVWTVWRKNMIHRLWTSIASARFAIIAGEMPRPLLTVTKDCNSSAIRLGMPIKLPLFRRQNDRC